MMTLERCKICGSQIETDLRPIAATSENAKGTKEDPRAPAQEQDDLCSICERAEIEDEIPNFEVGGEA